MAVSVERLLDMNEEFWDAVLDRADEFKKWGSESLRCSSAWRLHFAIYLLTLASSFGSPLTYPALLSSIQGDHIQRLEDINQIWISGFSLTSVVSALCTLLWFAAADCVCKKKLLVVTVTLKGLHFLIMGTLLSGILGRWSMSLWYLANLIEGFSPSQVINVEYCMWLDFTEGNDELRSNSLMLSRVLSAVAAGLGTGFSIFCVQLGLLPYVLSFTLVYFALAVCCAAGVVVLLGLQVPKQLGERPALSLAGMLQMIKDMSSLLRDRYNFWAVVNHCLGACCAFRHMVVPTFCMVHYSWSQEEYMLMMGIPAIGVFFAPLVPTLNRLMGPHFFYLYVDFLNFLFFDLGSILYPLGSEIYIMQSILHAPLETWRSALQQEVLARVPYNTPEVRGRSAALFSGLTKVVSGVSSPVLSRTTFEARAQTFEAQTMPFVLCAAIALLSRIIFVTRMWSTESAIIDQIYYPPLDTKLIEGETSGNAASETTPSADSRMVPDDGICTDAPDNSGAIREDALATEEEATGDKPLQAKKVD